MRAEGIIMELATNITDYWPADCHVRKIQPNERHNDPNLDSNWMGARTVTVGGQMGGQKSLKPQIPTK